MEKYTINFSYIRSIRKTIEDTEIASKDAIVFVSLLGISDDNISEYYSNLLNVIKSGNRLIVFIDNAERNICKSIANMCVSHGVYEIYTIDSNDELDKDYIELVEKREPTFLEVQEFISSDITAYDIMSEALIEIKELVANGDSIGLEEYIRINANTIEKIPTVTDYLKLVAKDHDMGILVSNIKQLTLESSEIKSELIKTGEELRVAKEEKKKLLEFKSNTASSIESKDKLIKELTEQASSGGAIIKSYSPVQTAMLNCKAKSILYFKEISYVRYTNSFINSLIANIEARGKTVKLVIYDNKMGNAKVYQPARVIGGSDYMTNKSTLLRNKVRLVVVEPVPNIITDIITHDNPAYDVVIVYDRLKQQSDIVEGNNVHKYFVVNSFNDYKESEAVFKINDTSNIITDTHSSLYRGTRTESGNIVNLRVPKNRFDIPTIKDYGDSTETAKMSNYSKLPCTGTNKVLMVDIYKTIGMGGR